MRSVAALLLTASLAACASTGGSSPVRERDVITAEEIARLHVATAYDVVQNLRPEFLRSRGAASIQNPAPETAIVYVDGVRSGGIDALHNLPRDVLHEIRYLNGADATTIYGTGHGGGAIQVITRRG